MAARRVCTRSIAERLACLIKQRCTAFDPSWSISTGALSVLYSTCRLVDDILRERAKGQIQLNLIMTELFTVFTFHCGSNGFGKRSPKITRWRDA